MVTPSEELLCKLPEGEDAFPLSGDDLPESGLSFDFAALSNDVPPIMGAEYWRESILSGVLAKMYAALRKSLLQNPQQILLECVRSLNPKWEHWDKIVFHLAESKLADLQKLPFAFMAMYVDAIIDNKKNMADTMLSGDEEKLLTEMSNDELVDLVDDALWRSPEAQQNNNRDAKKENPVKKRKFAQSSDTYHTPMLQLHCIRQCTKWDSQEMAKQLFVIENRVLTWISGQRDPSRPVAKRIEKLYHTIKEIVNKIVAVSSQSYKTDAL